MHDYKLQFEQKAELPALNIIQQDIALADNWNDAYWIGNFLYDKSAGEADRLIMDAYEKAFDLGLNIHVNRRCFLNATQQIAKVYFQFKRYDEVINKLMVLDSFVNNLPDWVNLFYVSAQIQTENILYWAEVPEMLFKRLDQINESDPESVKHRKFLFLEFLNRISELSKTKRNSEVNTDAILAKAAELGVSDSRECLNFKLALGIVSNQVESKDILTEEKAEIETKRSSIYEQMMVNLNSKLSELQRIVDKQSLTIAQSKKEFEDQHQKMAELQTKVELLENNGIKQAEELKNASEYIYTLRQRYQALENQLSGNEITNKQLEENASIISELKIDVEDLKTALKLSRERNDKLQTELTKNFETIESLKAALLQSQENTQELHATIESQKSQIETAKAELVQASGVAQRQLTVPFTQKPFPDDIPPVNSFLYRRQKILIIGGSEAKETHLRGKLKSMGFDFSKDQLEFELEYDNIKDYTARIKQWDGKYAGIIVGPCPHKVKDTDGYSSFIAQMESEKGYPHVERARTKAGTLKISTASIGDAMIKMARHLYINNTKSPTNSQVCIE